MTTNYTTIILFFLLTIGSTIGGWALTGKLGGVGAANSFLRITIYVPIAIILLQTIWCFLGRHRLLYQLLIASSLSVSLTWFMFCLILPLLWIPTTNTPTIILIFGFLVWVSISNARKGIREFNQKWQERGMELFKTNYDRTTNTINWEKVRMPMKLSISLHVPGVSHNGISILSGLLIVSMVLGLCLWRTFPAFSVLAWGIPSCAIMSVFVQMFGMGAAQAWKIAQLEKKMGSNIRPLL